MTGDARPGRSARGALRRVIPAMAAVVVFLGPLLVGGGPPWAQIVVAAAATALFGIHLLSRGGRVALPPFLGLFGLSLGVTAIALIPLPRGLVGLLSPRALDLRAEVSGGSGWIPLTLDVPATVLALVRGVAWVLVFTVVAGFARRSRRAITLTLSLGSAAVAMAIFALVQKPFAVTKILGLIPVQHMSGGGVFGTFVNTNHAASFFAIGLLLCLGLAIGQRGGLRGAAIAGAVLSGVALALTRSRGGVLGAGCGVVVLMTLSLARRFGTLRALALAGVIVGISGGAVLWLEDGLRGRLVPTDTSHPWDNQKTRGWLASAALVADYPLTGVGRGAFEAPTTRYRSRDEGVRLQYPENLPLQWASEWGLPATLLFFALVLRTGRRIWGGIGRLEPSSQAALAALIAVGIHELFDFGLELPGVALPAAALLGIVVARLRELKEAGAGGAKKSDPRAAYGALVVATGLVLLGVRALPFTMDAERTLGRAMIVSRDPAVTSFLNAAIVRHPADSYLELLAATEATRRADRSAGRHLNRAQRLFPADPAGHLQAARWLATIGRRSQAAIEYRLARERGSGHGIDEAFGVVGETFIDRAEPTTARALMDVAFYLIARGRLSRIEAIAARAVDLGAGAATWQAERLTLALGAKDRAFVVRACESLLRVTSDPRHFLRAAEALAGVNEAHRADQAIDAGLRLDPRQGALVLGGVRLRLQRNDFRGAMSLLTTRGDLRLTLKERGAREDLLGDLAERLGDPVMAAQARARALLIRSGP